MSSGRKEYTFLWNIENYSCCWHKNGEKLSSPEFSPDGLGGTSWSLNLWPRGNSYKSRRYISLFLVRSEHDAGPENFDLKFELSILTADESGISSKIYECRYQKGSIWGWPCFLKRETVLLHRKTEYLPQDTLIVRCKMWKDKGSITELEYCSARTRIGFEKISFLHTIESFSALENEVKKTVQIPSHNKTGCVISSNLYITDVFTNERIVIVEIVPSKSNYILCKQRISLLDISGKKIECVDIDNRLDVAGNGVEYLPLSLTRAEIINRKHEYLPNDELSLLCECIFSTGVEFQKIEATEHELPAISAIKNCYQNVCSPKKYNASEKLAACPSILDDLKTIYNKQHLTDVELKTETKSFPAHKLVLCARSSVFNAMLTKDMKEKNTNCIRVDDLDNDTLQQFLHFLYSDNLESLNWESAVKLYDTGDKYAVEKLRVLCSSFLADNINSTTASELLLLADAHNDSDLKKFVENFILEHEEEVFGSDEWEKLIDVNPQLVIKTMHLKYKREK
ncbi:TD and POZ domain-containing protein 5 [Argiope bruennichi]|uniref:TD and POZ domain-containing protein 5 n=1 Tax=Argiope bruennichi TaxID=94029 RepID=A0A8T0EUL4_ARGBR|nr:TD and POZ domain-containing protein 5 [Argiope bruennichi]